MTQSADESKPDGKNENKGKGLLHQCEKGEKQTNIAVNTTSSVLVSQSKMEQQSVVNLQNAVDTIESRIEIEQFFDCSDGKATDKENSPASEANCCAVGGESSKIKDESTIVDVPESTTKTEVAVDEVACSSGKPSVQSEQEFSVVSEKSSGDQQICRICLEGVNQYELISPCNCSGTTKYAHEKCLLQWFFRSSKKSCEVCLGPVKVIPIGFKPVQEWRLPERNCDFIVYLFGLYFIIMVLFTCMITWIAIQGCSSPVCITLYAVCAIAFVYFFYCCGCVDYSQQYWRSLVSINRIWRIYGREDSLKCSSNHELSCNDVDNLPPHASNKLSPIEVVVITATNQCSSSESLQGKYTMEGQLDVRSDHQEVYVEDVQDCTEITSDVVLCSSSDFMPSFATSVKTVGILNRGADFEESFVNQSTMPEVG